MHREPRFVKRVLREPLLHFLLIGVALFLVYGLVDDRNLGTLDNKVVVSAGRIEQLENIFIKTWQRPPTANELKGLVDDFILEEIYYRQAVAMGIDRDDTVIRRRLRQKFEFLTDDMAAASTPSDEELAMYLSANAGDFLRDGTYTFRQIYLDPGQPDVERTASEQLAALRTGNTVHGGAGLLPASFEDASVRIVDGSFGLGFAQSLDALPVGEWVGPIESGLGLHLIRLETRIAGSLPNLEDIRPTVEREWANQKRLDTRQLINEQLLQDYDVVIEWPSP
jgi:hypothetical protein